MPNRWSQFKIGKVNWIENNRAHPHRNIFEDYVIKSCNSVIEVGPGELIEYGNIIKKKKIDYTIVDISDSFLKNCQEKYPNVRIIKASMEKFTVEKRADVIYAASVLEHSPDLLVTLQNMMKSARNFHFVMFKWKDNGDSISAYHKKKQYWSTSFGLNAITSEIEQHGNIEYMKLVYKQSGKIENYQINADSTNVHRTGDYLIIHGSTEM